MEAGTPNYLELVCIVGSAKGDVVEALKDVQLHTFIAITELVYETCIGTKVPEQTKKEKRVPNQVRKTL